MHNCIGLRIDEVSCKQMLVLLTHEPVAFNVRTMNAHIHEIMCSESDDNMKAHVNATENFDERTLPIYGNAKAPKTCRKSHWANTNLASNTG